MKLKIEQNVFLMIYSVTLYLRMIQLIFSPLTLLSNLLNFGIFVFKIRIIVKFHGAAVMLKMIFLADLFTLKSPENSKKRKAKSSKLRVVHFASDELINLYL